MKIALIEDDIQLSTTIRTFLEIKGHHVTAVVEDKDILPFLDSRAFDLYIIDINLPRYNGIELTEYIRKKDIRTPIIIITASIELENLKNSFKSGCNEYIKKPFHLEELEIRIENVLGQKTAEKTMLAPHAFYDFNQQELCIEGECRKLRKKERRLLEVLLHHLNQTVSSETIENYVWENEIKDTYPLRQLVNDLRKRLGHYEDLIVTERGVGYRLKKG